MNTIYYQRLSENAPELDIDEQNQCINIISLDQYSRIDSEGASLLRDLYIEMPMSTFGLLNTLLKDTIVNNNFIPYGFQGTLDYIKFFIAKGRGYFTNTKEGEKFGSLFLIDTQNKAQEFNVQEKLIIQDKYSLKKFTSANTNERSFTRSFSLTDINGKTFNQSRLNMIHRSIESKKQESLDQKINEIKRNIKTKIKLNPIPNSIIPDEVILKFVDQIYGNENYSDKELEYRRGYDFNYNYVIHEFLTSEEAMKHMENYKDNTHYYHYKKWNIESGGRYYALIAEVVNRNPFD